LLEKYHGLNHDLEGPICLSLSARISQPFSSVFSHNKSASAAAAAAEQGLVSSYYHFILQHPDKV
jgi:hypothetical protein